MTPVNLGTRRDRAKVCVAYPHPVGEVDARFHKSLVNLLVFDAHGAGRIVNGGAHLAVSSGAQITRTRNAIVRNFLALDGIEWLWCVDADMTFEPDVLEQLIATAHPTERPIVGGLCFALLKGDDQEVVPTIYHFRPDGEPGFVRPQVYPRDELVKCAGTGAACLLIHRSVLVKMGESFAEPWPWFAETIMGADSISEDLTFCLRAGSLGFPTHVDTRIKIGHVKPVVIDEDSYLSQFAAAPIVVDDVGTFAVIPTILPAQVTVAGCDETLVIPNDVDPAAELNLSAKWNAGLEWAEKRAVDAGWDQWNVLILNDDAHIDAESVKWLNVGLRSNVKHLVAYPNVHELPSGDGVATATRSKSPGGRTLSGHCFMVRGEAGLRFDERFRWWYGDTDLEAQVHDLGGVVVTVGGASCVHDRPTESTRGPLLEQAKADEAAYAAKWKLDAAALWLAQNPQFGGDQ